jgi:hypothetical protein
MNIITEDLLHDAALTMVAALNAMPAATQARVAEAHDAGGECELRIRARGDEPAYVGVWLCAAGGDVELVRLTERMH